MCKRWTADAGEHRAPQCFKAASATVVAAEGQIVSALPTRATVEGWHLGMFAGVPPIDYYAGNCRGVESARPCLAINVSVGPNPGSDYQVARQDADSLFHAATAQILKLESELPSLSPEERMKRIAVVVGVTVGAFIKIHPFVNGNGRTSRMLWRILLRRFNLPAQLSVVKRPDAPYDSVMNQAMTGDYSACISMVLNGLASGAVPAAV
ncbi:MAG: Fic family protein [Archangium sp.]|nr:Fic family protein [Archangium sp.]